MMSLGALTKKIFGSANERKIKAYQAKVDAINAMESELSDLSNEQLQERTPMLRRQIAEGAKPDDILVPAFATVREAAKRTLCQRHFDVQLIGGMALHAGQIAEMKTGEGKTLVATLPIYLNALTGKGSHVVTVNDYLAQRDAKWMSQIYNFLGLSVGVIEHGLDDAHRKQAYACDITYGTNNEFGFDYLRDNMKYEPAQMVQRGHHFAIVDEVDSILIDEARTPLIISGPLENHTDLYVKIDALIQHLTAEHFEINEKNQSAILTDLGNEHAETLLRDADLLRGEGLYDIENVSLVHHINQALKAHKLFQRDRDYIVKNQSVVIIDEFTGRMMPGRRYSDGLHQALEAKEAVTIQPENQTLASITFQNYFRLYDKLSGMTGTAATEANEFLDIYNLDLLEIPTNLPIRRIDDDDEVYRTAEEKYQAIVALIEERHAHGQPILVGTTSIEKSELIARTLEKSGFTQRNAAIPSQSKQDAGNDRTFQVLNARYHEQEAFIIAQAGTPGAVTIATNMAGRGTDIQLGGNADMRIQQELGDMPAGPERDKAIALIRAETDELKRQAREAGGLYVIGTERHESRRIDNQLRGRSGRQGDPGHSRFFLSLEDDLMRIFGSERMDSILQKLGLKEGEAIIHPWINKALEKAQQKVEARNFDIRRNLLKFDDVMNDQRKVIFEQRIELMTENNVSETTRDMRHEIIEQLVSSHMPEKAYAEQWDVAGLKENTRSILAIDPPMEDWSREDGVANEEVLSRLIEAADKAYALKTADIGVEIMQRIEKNVLLQSLDHLWREHLATLDHLRQVIGLRGYGQRDPLNEYKTEAFALFEGMLERLRETVTRELMHVQITHEQTQNTDQKQQQVTQTYSSAAEQEEHIPHMIAPLDHAPASQQSLISRKVGRNVSCPCGSGRKFKHCHGKL